MAPAERYLKLFCRFWFILLGLLSCNKAEEVVTAPPPGTASKFAKIFSGTLSDLSMSVHQISEGGFMAAGYTISSGSGGNDFYLLRLGTAGDLIWGSTYGGSGNDNFSSGIPTTDGGFILCGQTLSFGSTDFDILVIKVSPSGTVEWTRLFGLPGDQYVTSIDQLGDGSYVLCGYLDTFAGSNDVIMIKLYGDGVLTSVYSFGGAFNDIATSIQVVDDGYAITGSTFTFGMNGDAFIMKVNFDATVAWTRIYEGDQFDRANDIRSTSDGGYILAGLTNSYGTSGGDFIVFKTDRNGYIYSGWPRVFGGPGYEEAASVRQTPDGGYIIAGSSDSYGSGGRDIFLLKLYGDGVFNWSRFFGASGTEEGTFISVKNDAGYILTGNTQSFGAGDNDLYILSLDAQGLTCLPDNQILPFAGSPVLSIISVTFSSQDITSSFNPAEPQVSGNSLALSVITQCSDR